jgi:hypothetical protein
VIDREAAEEGVAALAVAIASILEDVHDRAVARPASLEDYGQAASDLGVAGADVATLAAAMKIFIRRAETREQALD